MMMHRGVKGYVYTYIYIYGSRGIGEKQDDGVFGPWDP